ncbi:MAG: acylphosphatase [Candidatus Binatus sp.]|uniref:acylphosphatase n=1 Tax=Candidatus Binatus sp. TaxID=2811406 RepID=UPI00271A4372|nr:acylphosphatase [Candidatus Binatus sp.]MDO8431723.1 acylphosphatase [Candidatus Binatus sp.]
MSAFAAETEFARIRLIIRGRVQGVGFRFAARDEAKNRALAGWVRNLSNGDVEIVAEGRRRDLQALVAWAHLGPSYARVDEVSEQWSVASRAFTGFEIR